MRATELSKCPCCKARVNPVWQTCILCKHPLSAQSSIGKVVDKEILSNEIMRGDAGKLISTERKLSSKGKPYAVKIRSRILDAEVWLVTHTEAVSIIPDGEVCFLPEEIRNLRGSTLEEITAVYRVKKELGGRLVVVNMAGGTA